MKAIFSLVVAVVASMLLVSLVIFGLGDSSLMVSPPEAVVENFTRHIVGHRYSQARHYLDKETKEEFSVHDLKQVSEYLEGRFGEIQNVTGIPEIHNEHEATAVAELQISSTIQHHGRFRLIREKGLWVIRRFDF